MQPSISFGINDWRNQLLDLDCTCQVKCIAYTLSMHWREGKRCYPSQRVLAEEAGVDPKTVRKALNFLEEVGLIKRKKLKIKALSFDLCEYEFFGVDTEGNTEGNTGGNTEGNTGGNHTPEIREIREVREVREHISDKSSICVPKRKNATLVPDDWQPDEKTRNKLLSNGLDPVLVAEKFKNSCHAKGLKYIDFNRAVLAWDWSRDPAVKRKSPQDDPFYVEWPV